MSFNIDWDSIKQNGISNFQLQEKLNAYLKEKGDTLLPKYITNAKIELIDIGDIAPEICLKDINNPLSTIYESLKDDFINEWEEKHNLSGENINFEPVPNNLDIQLLLDLKYIGDFQMVMKADLTVNYPSENFIKLPLKLYISDLKIHSLILMAYLKKFTVKTSKKKVEVQLENDLENAQANEMNGDEETDNNSHSGSNLDMNKGIFTILCDVEDETIELDNSGPFLNQLMQLRNSANTPIPMGTPLLGENTNISNTGHINNFQTERINFIRNISIRTEIGEGINPGSDRSILRNIQDLETMLVELLRKFMRDEICYPNWLVFDF